MTLESPNNPMQTLRLAINKFTVNRKFIEINQSFKTLNPQMLVYKNVYFYWCIFSWTLQFSFIFVYVCMQVYTQICVCTTVNVCGRGTRNQYWIFFFPITPDLTICSRISLSTCNSMAWLNSWANELWGSDYLYHPLTASST